MADTPQETDPGVDFDLDEDLFNFDDVLPDAGEDAEDDLDLDEIFAAFHDKEEEGEGATLEEKSGAEAAAPSDAEAVLASPTATPASGPSPPTATDPRNPRHGPAPAADPTAEGVPAVVTPAPGGLVPGLIGKGVVMVLVAMTLLNVTIALYTFENSGKMRQDLDDATREMAEAATDIREDIYEQARAVNTSFMPVVAPSLENHPTFDRALADIETGNFAKARERVYALLAVVDRMPLAARQEVEAHAGYLLAKSFRAEAVLKEASP